MSFYGKHSTEWPLKNTDVHENFKFIHCAYLNDSEVEHLSKSDADVVLYPFTEGNLGDVFFVLQIYQAHNGN